MHPGVQVCVFVRSRARAYDQTFYVIHTRFFPVVQKHIIPDAGTLLLLIIQ